MFSLSFEFMGGIQGSSSKPCSSCFKSQLQKVTKESQTQIWHPCMCSSAISVGFVPEKAN